MTSPTTSGPEPGQGQGPARAPGSDQLQQHPDGAWPVGWVCLDEAGEVVVWNGTAWQLRPPKAGVDPGLYKVLAWKLGRDGELP
jgi:hypothetical protein